MICASDILIGVSGGPIGLVRRRGPHNGAGAGTWVPAPASALCARANTVPPHGLRSGCFPQGQPRSVGDRAPVERRNRFGRASLGLRDEH